MKQLTKGNVLILALSLCAGIVLAVLMFGMEISPARASADEVPTPSIEDVLTFSLYNNNKEYKVSARNKQITEIEIPAEYNGIPVTEIADNAFMNCKNLTSVEILHNVKRIGNNAFANCTNLEVVNGMGKVEKLGNNAFANCTKLDNPVLPVSIDTLGSNIFRNNPNTIYVRKSESEMNALNSNWNSYSSATYKFGNELVLSEVYGNDGKTAGYSITMQQSIDTDLDVVLGDTYNGLPLLEIEEYAFSFSSAKSFTLQHGEIVIDADSSGEAVSTHGLDCDHVVNIASGAFSCLEAQYINLTVDVTFNDKYAVDSAYADYEQGHSTDIFSGSTARSIMLPNNLNMIPRSAFANCENLREITNIDPNIDVNKISSNITTIGSQAFDGCTSIINLYIPGDVKNMGNSVFFQWGDSDVAQAIHFEDLYEAPVGQDGYNWDENWLGTTYDNVVLNFKSLTVVFDKDGGKDDVGTVSVKVMYNKPMPEAIKPERDHYHFEGYYSGRNRDGVLYYDRNMVGVEPWDKKHDGILYAYWVHDVIDIRFEKSDGAGGSDIVIADYGMPMPAAQAPELTGYKFSGYYTEPNGVGTKYYNADMTSAHDCDFDEGVTLYAHWTPIAYTITFYYDDTVLFVCDTAYYNERFPQVDFDLPDGLVIMGFYAEPDGEGDRYYDRNMNAVIESYGIVGNLDLYAARMATRINYVLNGGKNNEKNPSRVYYSDKVVLQDPTLNGYNFIGWYLGDTKITELYNLMDEKITLTAIWEYTIKMVLFSTPEYVYVANHEYVYISLSAKPDKSCKIYVSPEVKQLRIAGWKFNNIYQTYYMNIIINNRDTDFTLILDHVKMVAARVDEPIPAIAMYTDNNSKLLLYSDGGAEVYGNGDTAIYCSTLYIGPGPTLKICGAYKVSRGVEVGGNLSPSIGAGAYAVIAENDIFISSKAHVYAYRGYDNETANPYQIKSGRKVVIIDE